MAQVEQVVLTSTETVAVEPGCLTPMLGVGEWSAQVRWLRVDGTRADYLKVGPHRFEVPAYADRSGGVPQMMLILLLEGSTTGTVDGHQVALRPGQGALVDARAEMSFRADGPMRAMRVLVDEDHLPPRALQARSLPYAVLKDSPLVTGCIGLVSGLLQLHNAEVEQHDEIAVGQPLIALVAGLLDEALHDAAASASQSSVEADRRTLINDHIDLHLTDPDLGPSSIAAALGVTVRTVHAAFSDSPDTVAGYIRHLRVRKAQALLVLRTEPPSTAVLAQRVGLQPEPFARAFKAATGLTARAWWKSHHQHGPGSEKHAERTASPGPC